MINFIITNIENILIAITSIVTGASALSAVTPTKKDDFILKYLKQSLDVLALNVVNAKTA